MKYLDELYSFTKILVCFSLLLFVTGFYFLSSGEPTPQQEEDIVVCGTVSRSYNEIPDDSLSLLASKGKELFEGNCSPCHAVYKEKVGPPLKDVHKRRDPKWIKSFVKNPMRKIKTEKDPYAVALYNQYNQTEMTSFSSLSDQDINAIIEYIRQ